MSDASGSETQQATQRVLGQPSWRLALDRVEAYVTETGGHVAPVTFDLDGRRVRPLAIAPWAAESLPPDTPPLLRALRGDFFCMPFGGNAEPYQGEHHPPHGETANGVWRFEALEHDVDAHTLRLSMETSARRRKSRSN